MKKNLSIPEASTLKAGWKWVRRHSLMLGVGLGAIAYLCFLSSFTLAGSLLGIAALISLWASDSKK